MAQESIRPMNRGFIRGTLKRTETFRNHSVLSVITDGSGVKAEIKIIVFDLSMLDGIKPGDRIDLNCHLEMRRLSVESDFGKGTKNYYEQRVIADIISLSKRALFYNAPEIMLDDDFNGGYPSDANTFTIVGTLRRIFTPNEGTCTVSVNTEDNGRRHMINAACFRRQKDTATGFDPGSYIVLTGSVVNGKDRPDGSLSEMFYCKDIAKVLTV